MIVDLLCNDLGKVVCFGSVIVFLLFVIESFFVVYYLVSIVCVELVEGKDVVD